MKQSALQTEVEAARVMMVQTMQAHDRSVEQTAQLEAFHHAANLVGRTEREELNSLVASDASLRDALRMRDQTVKQIESYSDQLHRQCTASEHAYAQISAQMSSHQSESTRVVSELQQQGAAQRCAEDAMHGYVQTVSYTHLTLPTIYSV